MQRFIAKWENIEIDFEIAETSTPLQLLLAIQDRLNLETCKIANLKKKKNECIDY